MLIFRIEYQEQVRKRYKNIIKQNLGLKCSNMTPALLFSPQTSVFCFFSLSIRRHA